eukprot:TRINITY_DN30973_c0_g1_i3.p1 TRINITY_DN30973_c0_g1~~TRINITY_DN30973_c0_g1_i3.p1  ORF type:complete len:365 (-),score=22.63 TRINITY_DN30973_c0_g1_i3:127-1221(-)
MKSVFSLAWSILWSVSWVDAYRHQGWPQFSSLQSMQNSTEALLSGGNITFTLINNSSLPLNVLALPKILSLYGVSSNKLMPNQQFVFVPGMAVYDFHAVISDGENDWNNAGAATWALTKSGTSYVVEVAVGAGTSGTIALGASAFVSTALAAVAVAPALISVAAFATFWGTAYLSSMTVSALVKNAMDVVRDKLEKIGRNGTFEIYQLDKMEGLENKPVDHPDRLLRFTDVVTETLVLETFKSSFPAVDVGHVVMTRRHAEAYFSAMVSEFKDWGLAKGFDRKWLLQGGFTLPKALGLSNWSKTSFEPLRLGEIQRSQVGLCHTSLVISYATNDWDWGELRIYAPILHAPFWGGDQAFSYRYSL